MASRFTFGGALLEDSLYPSHGHDGRKPTSDEMVKFSSSSIISTKGQALAISEVTLAAIREAYRIWNESGGEDMRPLLRLMTDDVMVTTLPDGAEPLRFSKACRGKVEMTAYSEGLIGDWELLRAQIEEMVSERNLVVVVLQTAWRNRRTDVSFDSEAVHVWRFRDQHACQIRLFFDSAKWSHAAGDAPGR